MSDPVTWTDEEIRDFVLTTAESESGFSRSASVGPITGLWETAALAMQRAWAAGVRPTAAAIDPVTATGFYLRVHGVVANVPFRDTAGAAQGRVTVTSATGGRLAEGSIVEAGGQRYATDDRARLTAGVAASVAVTAEAGGAAGNVAAGTAAAFASGTEPDDANARLDAQWITVVGFDADDLTTEAGTEAYRVRLLVGYEVRGDGPSIARYRLAAIGVPDLSSVRVGRSPRAYGSADVVALFAGRLPTDDELDLVRAEIARAGLVGRDVRVRTPDVVTVAVTATITGTATTDTVEEAIDAWWRAHIGIGDDVLRQDLFRQATVGVEGLDTIDFSSPGADLDGRNVTWYQPAITVTRA